MTFPLVDALYWTQMQGDARTWAGKETPMKHSVKSRLGSLTLALILALSLAVPALAAESAQPAREESAAQAAGYAMQYGGAVSIQYAVWQDGKITLAGHSGVYSKTENRALLDTDLYGIGSVSKVYTTAAVMQLAQAGRIRLDAPVTRYLPKFKMADERYRQITVRMLLNHSSGLMGTSQQNAFLFADEDRQAAEKLLERLASQRLKADPGAYSVYCNDGFTLAELVVEAVSGKSFPEYVRERILKPAGLENTFAPQDEFDASRLAKTYLTPEDTRPLAQDCLGIVGTGGLYASASDLAAFGGALTGDRLLNESARRAMANAEYARGIWPEDTDDALSYGLGWDCVEFAPFSYHGIQALVKGGDTQYYHAGLVVLPEYKMAAAVLSSGGVSTYNEMAACRMLIDALGERGVALDETAPALPAAQPAAMPGDLTALSGYYGATSAQYRVDITAEGRLTMRYLTVPGMEAQTFAYHDDGTFRNDAGTALLSLVKESNGQVYLYQKACAQLPGLGLIPISNYAAVKLPDNTPTDEAQAAWDTVKRTGFLLMSEKASSQIWLSALAGAAEAPEYVPGYIGAARIVDETRAEYAVQLPGTGGRDGQDLLLEERGGVTWYTAGDMTFAEASILRPIYGGSGSYCTIQPDGYARWYTAGAYAGCTMAVNLPEGGGFTVYDAAGTPVASSAAWGDTGAVLPKDGYVVFCGDAGDRFDLTFARPAA